jgi:hypothetical protein
MLTTTDALTEELAAIRGAPSMAGDETALRQRAGELGLSALCLSGGGIRSAAFCLGVLQALARGGLLGEFDYLSTVSGGGYIGAWLQTLIHRRGSIASAIDELCDSGRPGSALRLLRNYTSYLAPESGLFSTDMWTNVVLYLRNVLLNFLVFLPILLAAVIAPVLFRTFIWAIQSWPSGQMFLLPAAGVALAFATCSSALGLPNHRLKPGIGAVAENPARDAMSPQAIKWFIYVPFLLWAFLAPVTLTGGAPISMFGIPIIVLVYAAALFIGFATAAIMGAISRGDPHPGLFRTNFVAWVVAVIATSAVVWAGIALAGSVPTAQQAEALAVFGPLWLAVSNGLHTTIFVGLRRDGALFDMDREWLARLSALKIRTGCLWAIFAFAAIAIPDLLLTWASGARPFWFTLLTPLASGPVAAWLGKQVSARVDAFASDGGTKWITKPLALNILATCFILALVALLGYAMQSFLGSVQDAVGVLFVGPGSGFTLRQTYSDLIQPPVMHILWPPKWLFAVQFAVALILVCAILLIDRTVNVNRYSMHAIYRNRLTRAFLGSARQAARKPDAFTQFDPNDALPLTVLAQPQGEWRLFHIINMTLNLTSGGPTSWAERKAMSFTASALTCGAALLPRPEEPLGQPAGVFVPTIGYAGREGRSELTTTMKGLTLATAMTVSGAAVSPNWGYHSSPTTAFLMTLFNVRLGAWLPNPATVKPPDLSLGRPLHAVHPMLGDLLGRADATSSSIYLSDGGHFENLGLYEMLRRRCRMILVVDAGQDSDCAFEDLGNAIRKAAIDQQIEVTDLDTMHILTRETEQKHHSAFGFAVGRVRYPEDFEPCGRLIYIKPSILVAMPTDALAYANLHQLFPHDPTPDQWFT